MTLDEIIRIAREAGIEADDDNGYLEWWNFAKLVAAHERENKDKIIDDLTKLLELKTKSEEVAINMIEAAVLAEREACAKLCDEQFKKYGCVADKCATAIRARGEK